MDRDDIVAKVEKYIAALVSGKYEGVAFSDDVEFLGPLHESPLIGKAAVLEFLEEVSTWVQDVRIRKRIVDDASVCLLIDFEAKNGTVVPMADYIELSDGKIVSIRPFYDPRPLLEIERV
jgi:hypothetical protein